METSECFIVILIFCCFTSKSLSQSILRLSRENHNSDLISDGIRSKGDDPFYCDSWRFTIETNDAGPWSKIPYKCIDYVQDYMTGGRYKSDSDAVGAEASSFINTTNFSGDGRDAWVFDIDETLLTNLPYYVDHGFGSEEFDENSFNEWVDLAVAPALPASLKVYNEVKKAGIKIFLLTGRSESQRNETVKNLLFVGYSNWEKLILRGESDLGKPAIVYKSEKRKEIEELGYVIHGNSGDQWSDLMGFSMAVRSFKLPNPMYFIA
ncbi:acid phosphatase 1-like [Impatiens glandulifera]|uniref:acid phosphatase 1-like n=1 Tax=Impatiens glandulifera TaxID=253017 RepID=UPI001FB0AA77|nr:acid phosphatase 1-like [Impatiens glandulifera]